MKRRTMGILGTAAVVAAYASAFPRECADARTSRNDALVELGRRLFFEPAASRLGKNSCATCHDPDHGFSDARQFSPDDAGPTKRHSQPLIDLRGKGFHWDGEFDDVRQLLVARCAPAEDARAQTAQLRARRREAAIASGKLPRQTNNGCAGMGPADGYGAPVEPPEVTPFTPSAPVTARLARDDRYADAFASVFGTERITTAHVLDAMDAFVRSIRSTTSAFDRYAAGDETALSPAARRGLALFEGRAGCAQCHLTASAAGRPALTDGKYHNTGIGALESARSRGSRRDAGRAGIDFDGAKTFAFKTPTLRDVALRPPYMHDGSLATLADVLDHYAATPSMTEIDPLLGRDAPLTARDKADLVAFLESLTGETRAGLGARGPAECALKVVDLSGEPVAGLVVKVKPFGDRLVAEAPQSDAFTTDDAGVARIAFPATTHALFACEGYELSGSRPVPDTARSLTLIATPRHVVSLRVQRTSAKVALPAAIPVVEFGASKPVLTLAKVRQLGEHEALYASVVPSDWVGPSRLGLRVDADGILLHELAMTGGASPDLRLAPGK
jgi:cytochrome c peroxidase